MSGKQYWQRSVRKIMTAMEKETVKEGVAKEMEAEKVVVVAACNILTIRQVTVTAEKETFERPNTLPANCVTRLVTISLIVRS